MAEETKVSNPEKSPPPAAAEAPSSESGVVVATKKGPVCPTCKEPLDVYAGEAVHKQGTGFCTKCGVRHHLKG